MNTIDGRVGEEIIKHCLEMNSAGINQGVSGNISVRVDDQMMIITPTGIPYDSLEPRDLVEMTFDGAFNGSLKPSSEWRIHAAIYRNYSDAQTVVHAHPLFATALAIQGWNIPAIHYMVTIGGGHDIRCADYATFGSEQLAENVVSALRERTVCLMAHHGMVSTGPSLAIAMHRAKETETLARQYVIAKLLGTPEVLGIEEIGRVMDKLQDYGLREKPARGSEEGE